MPPEQPEDDADSSEGGNTDDSTTPKKPLDVEAHIRTRFYKFIRQYPLLPLLVAQAAEEQMGKGTSQTGPFGHG